VLRRVRGSRSQEGSVTAEFAMLLPPVLLVFLLGISLVGTVHAQLRCVDAAREGARLAARGEERARVVATAESLAPSGADATLERSGDFVVVTVTATARPLARLLPGIKVRSRASVEAEDR